MKLRLALSVMLLSAALGVASCGPDKLDQMGASVAPTSGATGFNELIAKLRAANEAKDYDGIVALSLTETMLDKIASRSSDKNFINRSAIRKEVAGLLKQTFETRILEINYAPRASELQSSASGRRFALVPATVLMNIDGTRVLSKNSYLALEDAGHWFMINPSSADMIEVIKAAYPDLTNVALSAPHMEAISQ